MIILMAIVALALVLSGPLVESWPTRWASETRR